MPSVESILAPTEKPKAVPETSAESTTRERYRGPKW
jgi:hypothetical protein